MPKGIVKCLPAANVKYRRHIERYAAYIVVGDRFGRTVRRAQTVRWAQMKTVQST